MAREEKGSGPASGRPRERKLTCDMSSCTEIRQQRGKKNLTGQKDWSIKYKSSITLKSICVLYFKEPNSKFMWFLDPSDQKWKIPCSIIIQNMRFKDAEVVGAKQKGKFGGRGKAGGPHLVGETSPGGRNLTWWEKSHLVGETSPGETEFIQMCKFNLWFSPQFLYSIQYQYQIILVHVWFTSGPARKTSETVSGWKSKGVPNLKSVSPREAFASK